MKKLSRILCATILAVSLLTVGVSANQENTTVVVPLYDFWMY